MPRILVTGSRTWTDRDAVLTALSEAWDHLGQSPDTVLVHGACPTGADTIADELWKILGYAVEPHPADWSRYGRAAGPKRNQEMVDAGADVCLAFLVPGSRGTADCARRAEKAGIPVRRVEKS